jgi:hypothetical protein
MKIKKYALFSKIAKICEKNAFLIFIFKLVFVWYGFLAWSAIN